MSLHCLVGHHTPQPSIASNQGFHFSSCRCCGRDLVKSGKKWRRVPKGFRVVWRSPDQQDGPRETRPQPQPSGRRDTKKMRAAPVRRDVGARRLEGLADLVRAALRVALWNCRDRWRSFRLASLALPRLGNSVLRLPAR